MQKLFHIEDKVCARAQGTAFFFLENSSPGSKEVTMLKILSAIFGMGITLVNGVDMPDFLVLAAPWTPFNSDGSVDPTPVKNLAPRFKKSGVNTGEFCIRHLV